MAFIDTSLAKAASADGTHDSTRYGNSRHSTRSFLAHHMECISHAAVHADAIAVANAAASLSFQLSMGLA